MTKIQFSFSACMSTLLCKDAQYNTYACVHMCYDWLRPAHILGAFV